MDSQASPFMLCETHISQFHSRVSILFQRFPPCQVHHGTKHFRRQPDTGVLPGNILQGAWRYFWAMTASVRRHGNPWLWFTNGMWRGEACSGSRGPRVGRSGRYHAAFSLSMLCNRGSPPQLLCTISEVTSSCASQLKPMHRTLHTALFAHCTVKYSERLTALSVCLP